MSASNPPLCGDALLSAVTASMVALHKRYYHREPVTAKTQLLGDDLLAVVMGGVYTDVEKTLIEIQRTTIVQETRSDFQRAMRATFIDEVERLCGRKVMAFISNTHVGPDMEIELFMLAPLPGRPPSLADSGSRHSGAGPATSRTSARRPDDSPET